MKKCLHCIQRVALIRTLAIKPDILLLDEPFSSLDYATRTKVEKDIKDIINDQNKSVIMITHDIEEAINLANKIIVLSKRPSYIKNIYKITDNKHKFYKILKKDLDINVFE